MADVDTTTNFVDRIIDFFVVNEGELGDVSRQ